LLQSTSKAIKVPDIHPPRAQSCYLRGKSENFGGGRCCTRHNSYFAFFSSASQSAHFSLQHALFIWIKVIVAAQIPGTGLHKK
jgi:hypothetical protein